MKKKICMIPVLLLAVIAVCYSQQKTVYADNYIVKVGDQAPDFNLALDPGAGIFSLYALKESGVTRNVIIDRTGRNIFLTRLFERKEFDEMKKVIFSELSASRNP